MNQNPATDHHTIEALFFEQMKRSTRAVTDPVFAARLRMQHGSSGSSTSAQLRSFDFQCSDRWIGGAL
jgi:hypothetical protein